MFRYLVTWFRSGCEHDVLVGLSHLQGNGKKAREREREKNGGRKTEARKDENMERSKVLFKLITVMKEDAMHWACSTHGRAVKRVQNFSQKTRREDITWGSQHAALRCVTCGPRAFFLILYQPVE
jgi:hypothetical protein